MNRRGFLTAAAASIFVPQFGRFFREGTGDLWVPQTVYWSEQQNPLTWDTATAELAYANPVRLADVAFRTRRWTFVRPSGLVISGTTIESDHYGRGIQWSL